MTTTCTICGATIDLNDSAAISRHLSEADDIARAKVKVMGEMWMLKGESCNLRPPKKYGWRTRG